jgi:hypothetical protein
VDTDLKIKIMKSYIAKLPKEFTAVCSTSGFALDGDLPVHRQAREEFYREIAKLYNELYAIRQEYPSLFYSKGEG